MPCKERKCRGDQKFKEHITAVIEKGIEGGAVAFPGVYAPDYDARGKVAEKSQENNGGRGAGDGKRFFAEKTIEEGGEPQKAKGKDIIKKQNKKIIPKVCNRGRRNAAC